MSLKTYVLGTLIWLIIILLAALPILILLVWKLIVIVVAKCFRRDLILPSALDIMQITGPGDIKSIVNFGLVCRVDGNLSLEDLQMQFSEKFLGYEDEEASKLLYEKLHCTVVTFGGFAFFKRVSRIDINEQIYIQNLKEGQLLEDLLSEWILTKYKADSPCWEVLLVPLKLTNQTAVAIKIHHAYADGYSMLYILDQLTNNTSPYLVKKWDETFREKVSQMLQAPCHLGMMSGDPQSNPLVCVKEENYRWIVAFTRMNLQVLKRIRRQHNVHFGAIILSLLGGAIRKYLLETKNLADLPSHLTMGTTLPWPDHPSKMSNTSARDKICNHWVTGLLKVPIQDDNPVERLLETEKSLEEFQNLGLHKFVKRVMIPIMWLMPVSVLRGAFAKDMGFSAGYSTTVGGDNYKLLGQSITQIHEILAIHDVNPFIPISAFSFSHSNNFELTISANPQHFPNREAINRIIYEHLPHELKRLSILSGIVEDPPPVDHL